MFEGGLKAFRIHSGRVGGPPVTIKGIRSHGFICGLAQVSGIHFDINRDSSYRHWPSHFPVEEPFGIPELTSV